MEVDIHELEVELLVLDEPTLELKPLPSSLNYAFLDAQEAKLVIISSQLDHDQEKQLLDVLR